MTFLIRPTLSFLVTHQCKRISLLTNGFLYSLWLTVFPITDSVNRELVTIPGKQPRQCHLGVCGVKILRPFTKLGKGTFVAHFKLI